MSKTIGIDLGTNHSCMAVFSGDQSVIIPTSEGSLYTPSWVAFLPDGERLIGEAAKLQAAQNPKNTIFSVKRLLGKKFAELEEELRHLPYQVVEDGNGNPLIRCELENGPVQYYPEQILAMILEKLKEDAQQFLNEPVSEVVVSVPASFGVVQRGAVLDTFRIAGLQVWRMITEPVAGALARFPNSNDGQTVLVADVGGGSVDFSILEIAEGVYEVKAVYGEGTLGGDSWDQRIIDWMANEFKKAHGIDLPEDPIAWQRMKLRAQSTKGTLSTNDSVEIDLPDLSGKGIRATLHRSEFENICADLFERFKSCLTRCLKDSWISESEISSVILMGSMYENPRIAQIIQEQIGPNSKLIASARRDGLVAKGLAIQGAIFQGHINDVLLLDVTPKTLSIETEGGVAQSLIERNTTIGTKKSRTFSTSIPDQTEMDIVALEGESGLSSENRIIGSLKLEGIKMAPRGTPQIEVTFDIDCNGILNVHAKDQDTGIEKKIRISRETALPREKSFMKLPISENDKSKISILRDGVKYGPYNEDTLRKYFAQGLISSEDQARYDGFEEWQPLKEICDWIEPISKT
jgi:molecular chaperone DnaK